MDELFFSYVPFEDVGTSCVMKLGKNINVDFSQEESKDNVHSLKLFIKSYFESISSGVNDLFTKVEEISKQQSKLENRMKKLELFSETTADELLGYYIEVFNNINKDPKMLGLAKIS